MSMKKSKNMFFLFITFLFFTFFNFFLLATQTNPQNANSSNFPPIQAVSQVATPTVPPHFSTKYSLHHLPKTADGIAIENLPTNVIESTSEIPATPANPSVSTPSSTNPTPLPSTADAIAIENLPTTIATTSTSKLTDEKALLASERKNFKNDFSSIKTELNIATLQSKLNDLKSQITLILSALKENPDKSLTKILGQRLALKNLLIKSINQKITSLSTPAIQTQKNTNPSKLSHTNILPLTSPSTQTITPPVSTSTSLPATPAIPLVTTDQSNTAISQQLLQTKQKAIEAMIQYYSRALDTAKEKQANNPEESQLNNQIKELNQKIDDLKKQLSDLK